MNYREIVYMVLDELKAYSDDNSFTEEHIIYLASKYRAFLLKQRYADIKKQIPDSNYQTIHLDLIEVPAIAGEICEGGHYLRSAIKVPYLMKLNTPSVYPEDNFYCGDITYVSRDKMKYVGHNKYLKNIVYCSIGPDGYLYFKSLHDSYLTTLRKVEMLGIFEDCIIPLKSEYQRKEESDILDEIFPLETSLVSPLIELIVKELLGSLYRSIDTNNNASDDLAKIPVKTS